MSQIYKTSTGGAGGVASVTGINGIIVSPTTGDVVASLDSPNHFIQIWDDFLSSGTSIGQLVWSGEELTYIDGTASNPGIGRFDGGVGGGNVILTDNSHGSFVVGGGSISNNFVWNLGTLSQLGGTYTSYVGFTDPTVVGANTPPAYGIYFQYTDSVNAGNWQIVCNNGTSSTVVNTAIAASIGFHNYGFVINASGTSVSFTIDGVSVGTITTNIPTLSLCPAITSVVISGGVPEQTIDLWYSRYTLTVPR